MPPAFSNYRPFTVTFGALMDHCPRVIYLAWWSGIFSILLFSCASPNKETPLFEVLEKRSTGLNFTNRLVSNDSFNLFKYMYFYNGAGVGAGDFNNDGLADLFFSSNQGSNSLYLNEGNMHFRDVTTETGIPQDNAWSTGVSIVDINNDGFLDIYVCRVGKYLMLNSHNQLLVCQGINKNGVPTYVDKAKDYGLDYSGFSTQAAFLDYDMDGDLDMFLLNHSVHENGTFRPRSEFVGTYHQVAGGRMYRNDGNHFSETTREVGINSSAIGYGLGIVVSDINLDGYPDIYIGNDFHENDYLYINERNGTFREDLNSRMMHTSQYTMGVDAADVNNDGYAEIISMDMLPSDPYILKRSLGEDAYDIFYMKIGYGYNYQYTRNNLQYNRRNGMFSETGLYSGIAATDWSWAPLFVDFDNDGLKDLFISNGIPKRMNDIDYINYISNGEMQKKIRDNNVYENSAILIEKFPQIKIKNKFFKNEGDLRFADMENSIQNDKNAYSNGAAYADFDNDGDLDIIVNNIDDAALLYKNKTNDGKTQSYISIHLKGPDKNINAVGARGILFSNGGIRTYEKYAVKGFQSSMEIPLQIGLNNASVDSAFLVWPDNTFQPLRINKNESDITLTYQPGLPLYDYRSITAYWKTASTPMEDITAATGLQYRHTENAFVEFDREPLIPHMVSTEGPALEVSDINHDSLQDVFIGASKGHKSAIFLQTEAGRFNLSSQPAIENDSIFEDVAACWTDVNNDGHQDLVVASGGNEYYGADKYLLPRLYMNDGAANFSKRPDAFDSLYMTASCVTPYDFNNDGFVDLFIGGRVIPWQYGGRPRSYLLQNDKTGKFIDVTDKYAKELAYAGFITYAVWFDLDKDGDKDLLTCSEWGGIDAFLNDRGRFTKKVLTDKKGWWNFILPCDINNDGNIDLIAGNLGTNSRLTASDKNPVKLYVNDFDGNGKNEQVLTYVLHGKEIPFANKAELEKQIPSMRKRFLYAEDFAKASLGELFSAEKLSGSNVHTANYFSNAALLNTGGLNFNVIPLPWEGQLTSFRDAVVVDANQDSLPDVLLVGNYYENNMEMGRYDADFGTMLLNKGNGNFSAEAVNGLKLKGQLRNIRKLTIGKKDAFIIARNNDSAMVIRFSALPPEKRETGK